jgi:hypothetical protein
MELKKMDIVNNPITTGILAILSLTASFYSLLRGLL